MSDDIYGGAYEAFIDEIYKNGGGEPSAVRAAVDCAVKSLRAELAAERDRAEAHFLAAQEADDELATIRAERDELRALLREARDWLTPDPADDQLLARIDAALKGDGEG